MKKRLITYLSPLAIVASISVFTSCSNNNDTSKELNSHIAKQNENNLRLETRINKNELDIAKLQNKEQKEIDLSKITKRQGELEEGFQQLLEQLGNKVSGDNLEELIKGLTKLKFDDLTREITQLKERVRQLENSEHERERKFNELDTAFRNKLNSFGTSSTTSSGEN
ncbi:hypothetical protein [Mycoplasma sp. 1012]